jgi:hypothetical protein
LAKVAMRVDDVDVLHLLKIMLKANGKKGVPQGEIQRRQPPRRMAISPASACMQARQRSSPIILALSDGHGEIVQSR